MPPIPPIKPIVTPPKNPGSMGPLAGTVIVVAVLLIGALYFWGAWLNRSAPSAPPYIPDQPTASR